VADRALGAGGTQHRHHIDGCFAHQRLNKSRVAVRSAWAVPNLLHIAQIKFAMVTISTLLCIG
jgi:hypothetical protein